MNNNDYKLYMESIIREEAEYNPMGIVDMFLGFLSTDELEEFITLNELADIEEGEDY